MSEQLKPNGDQLKPKKERKLTRREKAKAIKRIANMRQASAEVTQALGLPMDLSPKVMRAIYSDLLPPEAREALRGQRNEKEVFNKATAEDKNASENNPK